jgi:hypothetical protein
MGGDERVDSTVTRAPAGKQSRAPEQTRFLILALARTVDFSLLRPHEPSRGRPGQGL